MKKILLLFLFFLFNFFTLGQENSLSIDDYVILSLGNYLCGEFGDNNLLYVIRNDTLFTLDISTMNETLIGQITGIHPGQSITTISYSNNLAAMFLGTTSLGSSELYILDLNTAASVFIGVVGQPGLIAFDIDCDNNIYSFDIIDDQLWEINPNTGTGIAIGPLGFDANYSMHAEFDLPASALYIAAFNNSTFSTQLRSVNVGTGATTLITDLGSIQITVFAIEGDCGPGQAINPQPPDSSINIPTNLDEISWENPGGTLENEIWWGTNSDSLVLVLSGGLFVNYTLPNILEYEQTYYWKIDEIGPNGSSSGKVWQFTTEDNSTYINEDQQSLFSFSLEQNYPNPFNPTTKIRFVIPNAVRNLKDFSLQDPRNVNNLVTLKVYDILGNEIATLLNEEKPAGEYEYQFNASELTSGIYFYQLKAGSFIQTRKMILLK